MLLSSKAIIGGVVSGLNTAHPALGDEVDNSAYYLLHKGAGHSLTKTITLSANNTTASENRSK